MQAAMGSFRIEWATGGSSFRRALLGIGAAHEIPFSDIAQILTVTVRNNKVRELLTLFACRPGMEEVDARGRDR